MPRSARRRIRRAIAAPIWCLLIAGCTDGPVSPEWDAEASCSVERIAVEPLVVSEISLSDLHDALLHAAGTLLPAIREPALALDVKRALEALSAGNAGRDATCRLMMIAIDALASVPEHAESLPDREALRLVLAMTTNALRAAP